MLARRLLLLAAVLLLLTALASALAPRESSTGDEPPARTSLPAGKTVTMSLTTDETAARVPVERGDRLELEVTGEVLDSVLIERLDRMDGIAPGTPARFDLLVEAPPGSYPIRLVEADRRIGSIVVSE